MKTSLIKLVAVILIATCANGFYQSSVLANDPPLLENDSLTKGSAPYEDAVRRYLERQQPKIVGGKQAPPGAFPWQVSLGVSWIADPFSAHFCGGSVLSERWIITAAHCLVRLSPAQVSITAGTNRLVNGATRRNVRRIIVHRNYNPQNADNDIALMELFDPLPTGLQIRPVSLLSGTAEGSTLTDGALLTVVGWGHTNEGGSNVRDLRYLDELPFVLRETCNRPLAYNGRVTNNMICAGVRSGGQDACQNDSGGPLTADTGTNPKLAGIVSWGEGCAQTNKVGVYTRVANYVDWVNACTSNSPTCNR